MPFASLHWFFTFYYVRNFSYSARVYFIYAGETWINKMGIYVYSKRYFDAPHFKFLFQIRTRTYTHTYTRILFALRNLLPGGFNRKCLEFVPAVRNTCTLLNISNKIWLGFSIFYSCFSDLYHVILRWWIGYLI